MTTEDRHQLEKAADAGWVQLLSSLSNGGVLPSLEWSLRWMPNGTLDVLWRASPRRWIVAAVRGLKNTPWYGEQRANGRRSDPGYKKIRSTWRAPTLGELTPCADEVARVVWFCR